MAKKINKKSMAKPINEKTFELNITSELLTLSKSFLWYLDQCPICHLYTRREWMDFLKQSTVFAVGLTQEQENDPSIGGYDVSINYTSPEGEEKRLMFLQFKAGKRKKYSTKTESLFHKQKARSKGITPEHISFTFNDAAKGAQHSTLRNLANNIAEQSLSVMYVFPRITEKSDFINKVGSLIENTSFIPVIKLDEQAFNQTPRVTIMDSKPHKYRTSYDGLTSEVNFFFFNFFYDVSIISELLSELICIQIERLSKKIVLQNESNFFEYLNIIATSIDEFIKTELKQFPSNDNIIEKVNSYIEVVKKDFVSNKRIPYAPSRYTKIIPKGGLTIRFDEKNDFTSINCQLF